MSRNMYKAPGLKVYPINNKRQVHVYIYVPELRRNIELSGQLFIYALNESIEGNGPSVKFDHYSNRVVISYKGIPHKTLVSKRDWARSLYALSGGHILKDGLLESSPITVSKNFLHLWEDELQ